MSDAVKGQAPKFSKSINPFAVSNSSDVKFGAGVETNEHRLEMRMKQIQFGKNTVGYDNYLAAVSKEKRGRHAIHPRTPDINADISKRAFEGQVKAWRRALHLWDNGEIRPDLEEGPRENVSKKRKSGDVDDLQLQNSNTFASNKRGKANTDVKSPVKKDVEEEGVPPASSLLIGEEAQDGYRSNEETFADEDVL